MPYKDPEKKKEWERKHRKGKAHSVWMGYNYTESAPSDWLQTFMDSGVEGFAIYHDRDVNPDTGELKKEHNHAAMRFSHAVDRQTAVDIATQFGILPDSLVWRDSWRAVARYLCHLDQPEKTTYSIDEVIEIGGADYRTAIHCPSDKYRTIRDMKNWVNQNDCLSFSQLMDYASDENEEWFIALCDNSAYVMREYIKSRRYDFLDSIKNSKRA